MKRERKVQGQERILAELESNDFCDFDKPNKAPVRKEKLSPTSKAKKEASRNEFVENAGVPDRVKSFREINSGENRPRARPGFVKLIRNGLRKVQNLIECRPSRAKTGLTRRENGIRFQKEE